MGKDHGNKLPEIPDWRIYRVEDVPELMKLQKYLACHGLSDPWLRNEVWRFKDRQKYGVMNLLKVTYLKGFKYGLIAAIITTGVQQFLF